MNEEALCIAESDGVSKCQERREEGDDGAMLARTFAGRYCSLTFFEVKRILEVTFASSNGIAAKNNILLYDGPICEHPQ